jgi:hypothetical protein
VRTTGQVFLGLAAFVGVVTLIYGITSGEESGTAMLLLSAVLALVIGAYLWQGSRGGEPVDTGAGEGAASVPEGAYLPHESVWPFLIGVGALVLFNGLALGLWGLIPGAVLTVGGIWGFARQSRRRD